jgi:hypothetical protein
MINNCEINKFDIVEITNELPLNRLGGVGSVIESLMSVSLRSGTSSTG